jgi:hypothetical protein
MYQNFLRFLGYGTLMGINYRVHNDTFRTMLMYTPTALLLLYSLFMQQWLMVSNFALEIIHGAGHKLIPFIDANGLNHKYAAWPDILVHLAMMVHAMFMIEQRSLTTGELKYVRPLEVVFLIGMLVNLYVSYKYDIAGTEFAVTSLFSTISVALYVSSNVFYNSGKVYYLPLMGLTIAAMVSHFLWVNFENVYFKSYKTIGDMYVNRYYESAFMFASWFTQI